MTGPETTPMPLLALTETEGALISGMLMELECDLVLAKVTRLTRTVDLVHESKKQGRGMARRIAHRLGAHAVGDLHRRIRAAVGGPEGDRNGVALALASLREEGAL